MPMSDERLKSFTLPCGLLRTYVFAFQSIRIHSSSHQDTKFENKSTVKTEDLKFASDFVENQS